MVNLWRWFRHKPSSTWLTLCIVLYVGLNRVSAMFEEPKPLAVWEDPLPSKIRPTSWEEKNFGQWCRNFSMNSHVQCPQGSAIHWYYCCGHLNTECCMAIQTWAIVVFGSFFILAIVIAIVSVLAYFDFLWSNKIKIDSRPKKPKLISKKYATVSGAIV